MVLMVWAWITYAKESEEKREANHISSGFLHQEIRGTDLEDTFQRIIWVSGLVNFTCVETVGGYLTGQGLERDR